jgi:hypothetical protein
MERDNRNLSSSPRTCVIALPSTQPSEAKKDFADDFVFMLFNFLSSFGLP